MSYYKPRRDPMVFKYHRSYLPDMGKGIYNGIIDSQNDYIFKTPQSLVGLEDGVNIVRTNDKKRLL